MTRLLRVFALFAVVGVATPVAAAAAPAADTLPQLPVRSYVPDDLPGYRMMGEVEGLQPVDRQMNPRMVDRAYTEFTRENLRADVNTYSISIGAYRYESVAPAREHAREVRGQGASWRDTLRGLPVTVARETQTIFSVGSALLPVLPSGTARAAGLVQGGRHRRAAPEGGRPEIDVPGIPGNGGNGTSRGTPLTPPPHPHHQVGSPAAVWIRGLTSGDQRCREPVGEGPDSASPPTSAGR